MNTYKMIIHPVKSTRIELKSLRHIILEMEALGTQVAGDV